MTQDMDRYPLLLVCAFVLVALMLVAPLWLIELPPMSDFPGHAAILFIQMHASDPDLSRYYQLEWAPIPDLASKLIVPLFGFFMPVIPATKLFISLGVVLWVCGPAAVQYALFRRVTPFALLAAFFAYNRNFTMGFINYHFAAGLGLFVIALWIMSAGRPVILRLAILTLLLTLLYFFHVLAMVFVAFFLFVFEIAKIRNLAQKTPLRDAAIICAASLPALMFLLLYPVGHPDDSDTIFRLVQSMPERIASLNWWGFAPEMLLLGGFVAWALLSGRARIHDSMQRPLLAVLLLCLVLPVSLFGGWGTHVRYPAMAAALLFAALEFSLDRRAVRAILVAAVCAAALDATSLTWFWHKPDAQIREMRADVRQALPRGARLLVAMEDASLAVDPGNLTSYAVMHFGDFRHAAEYAVIDRATFNPLLFTQKGQHIVVVRPEWQPLAAATTDQSEPVPVSELAPLAGGTASNPEMARLFPYLRSWPCTFDHLLVLHLTGQRETLPPILERIADGEIFDLYRIRRPAACAE